MARDRGKGCPKRWGMAHSSRYEKPSRPVACPCLWSDKLVMAHFQDILMREALLALEMSALIGLMWDFE